MSESLLESDIYTDNTTIREAMSSLLQFVRDCVFGPRR